jgi:hypothetical protein
MSPGFGWGHFASVLRYDSVVIALPLLAVAAFVLIRRRVLIQREGRRLAERSLAQAYEMAREREIIGEMERDFLDR